MKAQKSQAKNVDEIISALSELVEDTTVPKNIKTRVENAIKALKEDDVSIGVDKALQELDEAADDVNIQPYTRTQIWGIVSMLEKI